MPSAIARSQSPRLCWFQSVPRGCAMHQQPEQAEEGSQPGYICPTTRSEGRTGTGTSHPAHQVRNPGHPQRQGQLPPAVPGNEILHRKGGHEAENEPHWEYLWSRNQTGAQLKHCRRDAGSQKDGRTGLCGSWRQSSRPLPTQERMSLGATAR